MFLLILQMKQVTVILCCLLLVEVVSGAPAETNSSSTVPEVTLPLVMRRAFHAFLPASVAAYPPICVGVAVCHPAQIARINTTQNEDLIVNLLLTYSPCSC